MVDARDYIVANGSLGYNYNIICVTLYNEKHIFRVTKIIISIIDMLKQVTSTVHNLILDWRDIWV